MPGLVVLTSTTNNTLAGFSGPGANLANLFNLTGITYGSSGARGKYLPQLAQDAGFRGLILGVWNPSDRQEIKQAEAASRLPVVLGYCVGNEGLHERYELDTLSSAIKSLRRSTGKPVTTSEQIDDYASDGLLKLGDWVFPNAHPYFHGQKDPEAAVRWAQTAWNDIVRRSGRFVLFKESWATHRWRSSGEVL